MLPEFEQFRSGPVKLHQLTHLKKSNRLPGSTVYMTQEKQISLNIQQYRHPLFTICVRLLKFFKKSRVTISEKAPGIRMEAVLTGEIKTLSLQGDEISLKAGQYHLIDRPEITALFKKNSACRYFITHYSSALLDQIGISQLVNPSPVKSLTIEMSALIQKVLHNPYQEKLMSFHHDNCIRELLLLHLSNQHIHLPGELSDKDLVAIRAADALMQEDLTIHDDIPSFAKKAGTTEYKLKKGFRQEFNMSVFERLTFHRMEYAKSLLKASLRTIDDIAGEVGYNSRNSFITAFKSNFGTTPHQWRMKQ